MNSLVVTLDLDWACEAAIEETLSFLKDIKVPPTIFTTHNSSIVETVMKDIEVGLHPCFGLDSSHGNTISEVVKYVIDLPHNFLGFRCHRYAICNSSRQAMLEAGMRISSNICTDLEVIAPFRDRFGLVEIPIFLEDGGYLWRKHSLDINYLINQPAKPGVKVITIHPMHFALNTPHFNYMLDIKKSVSREEWNNMTSNTIKKLKWQGRGVRDLLTDLLQLMPNKISLGKLIASS